MARLKGISPASPETITTYQHKDEQRRQRRLKPLQHDISLFQRFGASPVKNLNEVDISQRAEPPVQETWKCREDDQISVRATPGRAAKSRARERVVIVLSDSEDDSTFVDRNDCQDGTAREDEKKSECDSATDDGSDGEWDGSSSSGADGEDVSEGDILVPRQDRTHAPSRAKRLHKSRPGEMRIAADEVDMFASLTVEDEPHNDPFSSLKYSPRSRNPSKKTLTPPPSPSKPLTSPKKSRPLPFAPHRPSMDDFWNQDEITTWTDQYSPQRTLSPRKPRRQLSDSEDDNLTASPRKSPTKRSDAGKAVKAARKAFQAIKHDIAQNFLRDVDERITKSQLQKLTENTGGIQIIWSKTLNSTAGRANWRREGIKRTTSLETTTTYRHVASIELAEKVIDDEERLLNVLAHEYCHLANFMISNVKDQPHGASFKAWAAKVTKAYTGYKSPNTGLAINIQVTTKHSYAISYKYAWRCTNTGCGLLYERHSKSVQPERHSCGACKGKLVQIRPVPRGHTGESGVKEKSAYQVFVKEHFATIKREMGPKSPHKDVMRELGVQFRAQKADATASSDILVNRGDANAEPDAPREHSSMEVVDLRDGEDENVDGIARILDFLTLDA